MSGCEQYHLGRTALLTDHVLTSGQLIRMGADPSKFPSVTENVRTGNNYFSERLVTFHALQLRTLHRLKGSQLAHLAGVAEMRQEMGIVSGSHWQSVGHALNARLKPDAVWHRVNKPMGLIEFDSGDYTRQTVHEKIEHFRSEGEIFWGMTSALRMSRWISQYPYVNFIVVFWWHDDKERGRFLKGLDSNDQVLRRNALALRRNEIKYRANGY